MKFYEDILLKISGFLTINDIIKFSFIFKCRIKFEDCFNNNEIVDGIFEPYKKIKQNRLFLNIVKNMCNNSILDKQNIMSFNIYQSKDEDIDNFYDLDLNFNSEMNSHTKYPQFESSYPLLLSRDLLINKYYNLIFDYGDTYIINYEQVSWFIFGICNSVEKELIYKYIGNVTIDDWMSLMRTNFLSGCEKYFASIRYVLVNVKTLDMLIVEHFFENGGPFDTQCYQNGCDKYKITNISGIGDILYYPYSFFVE